MPRFRVPPLPRSLSRWLARSLDLSGAAASLLVLPLALLLCLQWPLRDWLHLWSREANDLAQILFGLYISIAITHASRRGAHLTPDAFARRYPAALRRGLQRACALCVTLPWSVFLLVCATPMAWQSLRALEGFAETFNPGYFILRCSVWLLALLVCLQALMEVFTTTPRDG